MTAFVCDLSDAWMDAYPGLTRATAGGELVAIAAGRATAMGTTVRLECYESRWYALTGASTLDEGDPRDAWPMPGHPNTANEALWSWLVVNCPR